MSSLIVQRYEIREYLNSKGASLFRSWLDSLDVKVKARIQARILNVEAGNLGEVRSLGRGLFELKFAFGPGYRVYYCRDKYEIILLNGGDKKTQKRDTSKAKKYYKNYLESKKDAQKK